jgi:DNA-binding transcriptional MerR regulator
MSTDHLPNPDTSDSLTLDELCEMAGVTVRTVRYYISEGLLPPPAGHGATARYTREHLDRLDVIAAMKARFLPLREIRRMLDGMDQRTVSEMATTAREAAEATPAARRAARPVAEASAPPPASAEDPATYIATLLNRDQPVSSAPPPQAAPDSTWRRVPITEDAELLIEDGVYTRRREQIESLVAWAQRVLRNS